MDFLIHDRFILGVLITCCTALCGCAASLVLTGSSSAGAKRAFLYVMFYVLAHETSSLIVLHATSPDMFRLLVAVRAASAYLLATSLLLFTGYYTDRRWLKGLALGVHLVSVGQVVLPFLNRQWAERLVMLSVPFEAQYWGLALWYALVPGTFCIILSVIFILHAHHHGRKLTVVSLIFAFLLLCMGALSILQLSTRDMVRDNMHLIIFLGLLAAKLKAMPFLSRDAKYISRADIHDGFSEAVIIFDRRGRVVHIHDGLKTIKLSDRLRDIQEKLAEEGVLNESGALSQGRILIEEQHPVHLQYKISPLQAEGKVLGRIINLRDVTELVNLQMELSQKNRQLELAFSRKQRAARAVRQLAVERERARILDQVNATANAYISRVRRDVAQLEAEMATGTDFPTKIRMMNEQLLEVTRSVIEEIRATVRKLNHVPEGCETLEDME
ncbi:MAG TPA: hypothetical protein PLO77_01685 [Thermoclostridium caenicola]|nr:hypothetical protein [Thermoclostridium caenicola]